MIGNSVFRDSLVGTGESDPFSMQLVSANEQTEQKRKWNAKDKPCQNAEKNPHGNLA
jgi:hypothetical protein